MKAKLSLLLTLVLIAISCVRLQSYAAEALPAAEQPQAKVSPAAAKEPLLLEVVTKRGRHLTFGELIDRLSRRAIVCLGEKHDSEVNHRVQLQIIKALYARDERLGVGMEMFQRPYQPAVDRYLSGKTDEKTFLTETEYDKRWGFDWSLYRPIVEFCRRNDLPLSALNVSSELVKRIHQVGIAGLTDDEKKQLGPIDLTNKAHRAYWFDRLGQMHGQGKATPKEKERSYEIMTVWDDYMARSAADFKKDRQLARMVVLAGIGHVEQRFDIPDRAARYSGGKVASVAVLVEGVDDLSAIRSSGADYVVIVRTASPQHKHGCRHK